MLANKTKKNLGIRATPERWRKLNDIARDQEMSVQQLIDLAIDRVIFGTGSRRAAEKIRQLPVNGYDDIKKLLGRMYGCLEALEQEVERHAPMFKD